MSVVLDSVGRGGLTLPVLIERIVRSLQPHQRRNLIDGLAAAGYSPVHEAHYNRRGYVVGEVRSYEVTDNFPRLSRSGFVPPLPPEIERITYVINVEAQNSRPLASLMSALQV